MPSVPDQKSAKISTKLVIDGYPIPGVVGLELDYKPWGPAPMVKLNLAAKEVTIKDGTLFVTTSQEMDGIERLLRMGGKKGTVGPGDTQGEVEKVLGPFTDIGYDIASTPVQSMKTCIGKAIAPPPKAYPVDEKECDAF